MRVLVTGGSGVLGAAAAAPLRGAGHEIVDPARVELDLFDPDALAAAVAGADGVVHLATRIPTRGRLNDPDAWVENDRLRRDATALLVDAALAAAVETFVVPTVAFVYPAATAADEDTRIGQVHPTLRSALDAEAEAARFAEGGGRGVALRLGLLDGPGTGNDAPHGSLGPTLHVEDAGRALAAALTVPSGIYNVCRDGERVANVRFKEASGWRPTL